MDWFTVDTPSVVFRGARMCRLNSNLLVNTQPSMLPTDHTVMSNQQGNVDFGLRRATWQKLEIRYVLEKVHGGDLQILAK